MLYVNPLSTVQLPSRGGEAAADPAREKLALQELEHFFLFTLLQEMRKTVPKDGLFGGGPARELYDEMLDDALSGTMAASGQVGVAKSIEEQLRAGAVQAAPQEGVPAAVK